MFFRFTLFVFLIFLLVACASPSSSPSNPGSNNNQPSLPAPATNEIFTPRDSHQVLNYDDKLWVLGGYEAGDKVLNDVWFSDDGRAWQQATADASWQPRSNFGAVVFNDKMWLLGGSIFISDTTIIDFNDVWDSTNGRDWGLVTGDAAWSPRENFDPFVFDNKMWVIGGFTNNSSNNDVWTSINGKDWLLLSDFIAKIYGSYQAVVFENKIWILSGGVSNGNTYVWYSSDGVNYTKSHLNNFDNFSALAFQNKIWLLGGRISFLSPYIFNREIINFDPAATSDTQTYTPNWHQRSNHASVVFKNKIWILGGYYYEVGNPNSNVIFNDIWSWDNSQSDWTKER